MRHESVGTPIRLLATRRTPPRSRGNSVYRVPWASREANAPGTRTFIAELFELLHKRINALCDQTLDIIEDSMEARRFLAVNRVTCRRRAGSRRAARSREDVYFVDLVSTCGELLQT
jgi:hypothetical protein